MKFYSLKRKHRVVFSNTSVGDIYFMVNYVEDKFKAKYEKAAVILYKKNWDMVQFFKTQGYAFENFYLFEDASLFDFQIKLRKKFDPYKHFLFIEFVMVFSKNKMEREKN